MLGTIVPDAGPGSGPAFPGRLYPSEGPHVRTERSGPFQPGVMEHAQ